MHPGYVADFGDYPKFSILRYIGRGLRVGVVWWICAGATAGTDGQHREYLDRPSTWRRYDPALFDELRRINDSGIRRIEDLETPAILSQAKFFAEPVPCDRMTPRDHRLYARGGWLLRAAAHVQDCDIVFLDPDNGFASDSFDPEATTAGKSLMFHEVQPFLQDWPDRPVIVYHHHTRRPGGHLAELQALCSTLAREGVRLTGMLRTRRWSPRAFFILNGDRRTAFRAREIAKHWDPHIEWHTARSLGGARNMI